MRRRNTLVLICFLSSLLAGCAWPASRAERTATGEPLAASATATMEPSPTTSNVPPVLDATPTAGPSPTPISLPPTVPITSTPEPTAGASGPAEYPVTEIPLTGPVAASRAEVSGMAWYGDYVILLPQYPDFDGEGDGAVYALSKAELLAYLTGARPGPLEPIPVPFVAPGLAEQIDGYEGYEAIAFLGDRVFLTIEAETAVGMRAYLVSGAIAPDLSSLMLDTATLAEIPAQSPLKNQSDEALLVTGDRLVTIYEANGAEVNPEPVAHVFDMALAPAGTIPFPNIEYRITDATTLDREERFWAINYFFPGDTELLAENDPLAERYGQGPTHAQNVTVERLVEFQLSETGISLVDTPPIQLELSEMLLGALGRNWEGLVRLDDLGFLLVTDLFPETILAFVPAPGHE
ncbi:MAG TPA: hypothetical protein VLY63_13635 [Anaerolineae bacterium]|nr:hypothetical protein [Anaerolineae bacterium]